MHTRSVLMILSSIGLIGVFIGVLVWYNSASSGPTISFSPQQKQLFSVGEEKNSPLNILATTLPQFAVKLADEKFSNLWQAQAAERKDAVEAAVVNAKKDTYLPVDMQFNPEQKQAVFTPITANTLKPGLYTLNVKIKTVKGEDITITQDFTWGVLAINTGKAVYMPGDTVKVGMGVLDDFGHTKCISQGDIVYDTAKVWLTITNPSGTQTELSTDNGTIVGSKDCAATSVTNNPDFQGQFVAKEIGEYIIHMTAETINGKRSIDDHFNVSPLLQPFDIMRTSYPTRIYPLAPYPVEITVVAHKDYDGSVTDIVPKNFRISDISSAGITVTKDDFQEITWQVHWKQGQTYKLTYTIGFPLVSPEFYLVGPLTIGSSTQEQYKEGREWQIASDAISLTQTPVTNTNSASGTSVTATVANTPTSGDVEIIVCSLPTNTSITTPTRNPGENRWNSAFSVNNGNARVRAWYRTAKATDSKTFQCNFNTTSSAKAIQVFEYSGVSTTATLDTSSTHTAATCSGGTFTSNTPPFTPGNPVVLVFASFTATSQRTVTGVTSGFTKETEFTGATVGTFSTHDQVTASIADYTDTITYNTGAGTCAAGVASFNSPISTSQNGYRFFANQNSLTPGTPLAAQNTPTTLATPHAAFRVRMLLDVDGTQTLAQASGDYVLQYATKSAGLTCSTATYNVVSTPTSNSDIAYNPQGLGSQVSIASSGNDPADTGYTTQLQSYYEDDTSSTGPTGGGSPGDITNSQTSISGNQAGLWDFSLIDNTSDVQSNTYCLKITNGDGSDITAYVRYAEITTFYNEVNIRGPGNSTGTTFIKGPGNSGGTTVIK